MYNGNKRIAPCTVPIKPHTDGQPKTFYTMEMKGCVAHLYSTELRHQASNGTTLHMQRVHTVTHAVYTYSQTPAKKCSAKTSPVVLYTADSVHKNSTNLKGFCQPTFRIDCKCETFCNDLMIGAAGMLAQEWVTGKNRPKIDVKRTSGLMVPVSFQRTQK